MISPLISKGLRSVSRDIIHLEAVFLTGLDIIYLFEAICTAKEVIGYDSIRITTVSLGLV